jgi:nitroimidazol reductase NimA-like FMN-containing flavoprotein (pyridoxamine 5'-phosphate oxidase superfamily)
MTNPTSRVDLRFGNPDGPLTSWDDTLRAIEASELFWITTVRRDGRPHVTPLVAAWCNGALYFTTGEGEQKFLNLQSNPRVAMTTGCATWDTGLDVVIEGVARAVLDDATIELASAKWHTKWDGRWQWEVHDGAVWHNDTEFARVFAVIPERVLAFAKGSFSQTTHRF